MSIAIQPIPPTGKVFTDEEVETIAREWTFREGATVQELIRFVEDEVLKRADSNAVSRAWRLLAQMPSRTGKYVGKIRPAAHWNEPSD